MGRGYGFDIHQICNVFRRFIEPCRWSNTALYKTWYIKDVVLFEMLLDTFADHMQQKVMHFLNPCGSLGAGDDNVDICQVFALATTFA